jgi:hypothetical protein
MSSNTNNSTDIKSNFSDINLSFFETPFFKTPLNELLKDGPSLQDLINVNNLNEEKRITVNIKPNPANKFIEDTMKIEEIMLKYDKDFKTRKSILIIEDFESEDFLILLESVVKGRLVKHNKLEKYYKYEGITWASCSYNDAFLMMDTLMEMHILNFTYQDYISPDYKKRYENKLNKWKNVSLINKKYLSI